MDCWGYGAEFLPSNSLVRNRYHGSAWGLEMYHVRAAAKISINKHSGTADSYANNMSLFETTGVGSLLLTDEKENLGELFQVGTEVVTYRDADDCIEKIEYYLSHEEERACIAKAGQQRTLHEHTYAHRMRELLDILSRYV